PESLEPFSLRLDDLDVSYMTPDDGNNNAIGQVKEFIASMTLTAPDGTTSDEIIRVNHPLRVHGSPVYLLADGYAPTLVIKNAEGEIVFSESVPFIPQGEPNRTAIGAVKVLNGLTNADGGEAQLGRRGFFSPAQTKLESGAYTSNY